MTITVADIKLLASERMTDTTDGGGRRTGNVIPDGVPGNIFPKVSRLDSVYGRVNLRKVYAHVDTLNTDTYAGAHAALIDAADNDKIKVSIFSTKSDFDDRTAARDRIESYVISGPESRMMLYGRQLVGQQAVTVLQRVEEALPDVGEVFCLSTEIGGVVQTQQYIRIQDVTHEVRTFTDSNGDFQRRVVTLKIGTPLRYEFDGMDGASRLSNVARNALVRTTTVADAARYFGLANVTGSFSAGTLTVSVDSVFCSIVPTNQREAAINTAQIAGAAQIVPTAAAAIPFRNVGALIPGSTTLTQSINLGTAVVPGSLVLHFSNLGSGGNIKDDGKGGIPSDNNGSQSITNASIDYQTGILTLTVHADLFNQGGLTIFTPTYVQASYIPGVATGQPAHLRELPVTLATRGTVYVQTLDPLPAKGTVYVDFRALGKWYRLSDDGTGKLAGGDAAYGTGTVDPVTGALVVTLGALPDVGSSVIIGWASPQHYTLRVGASAPAGGTATVKFTLSGLPIKPSSLSISFVSGGTTYTANANAAGAITGTAVSSGTVNYTTGEVTLQLASRIPNPDTGITATYSRQNPNAPAAPTSSSGTATPSAGSPTFNTVAGLQTQGIRVLVPIMLDAKFGKPPAVIYVPAADDGSGNLVTQAMTGTANDIPWAHAGGTTVGSVTYATGVVTINFGVDITIQQSWWRPATEWNTTTGWSTASYRFRAGTGNYAWLARTTAAETDVATTEGVTMTTAPVTLDFTLNVTDTLVPGSLQFTAFGRTYYDRNGSLYYSMNPDGTGTLGGTVNYATGVVVISDYPTNTALGLSVTACLTKHGDFTATNASFRTAGSPLRPASTFIQVTSGDGIVLTATCDQSGNIVADKARGKVNQQFGLVSIEWGQMVVAAGHEAEWWYDATQVVGGMVWQPREVMPDTLTYSTVVLSSLPVDADILGLDPVRLPSDGRVPIFRPGDPVLVHNTQTFTLPNPAVAGATYNVGRPNLADVVMRDANGVPIPASQFAYDLQLGTVTMAANMNLAGYTQPLKVTHRIEELNLATDVQINGQISLAAPLSRDFDASTKVSSCLLFGDMFARVSNVFDQVTWTSVWSDARIGADGTAQFNNAAFPITVSNTAAVTERWRINFTSTTAFQVIGEQVGVIATGDINTDCSPVNLLTGKPYFTIPHLGWGGGWGVGNQLRFNTVGATGPVWMARTVLPGATLAGDSVDIQVRGDVDA